MRIIILAFLRLSRHKQSQTAEKEEGGKNIRAGLHIWIF
jgi:hypothetical protein